MAIDTREEKIPVDQVIVPENRRRFANFERDVENILDSLHVHGYLIEPIVVNQDYTLIAGLRRLEAWKRYKKGGIQATVVNVDPQTAEVIEIDENLCRGELEHAERMDLLERRQELHEQLHPETKRGVAGAKAKHSKGDSANADSALAENFVSETARKTGLSKRTIQDDLAISKALDHEAKDAVKGTPVANNREQLRNLSKLPKEEQKKVAAEIKADPTKKVPKPGREAGNDQLKREALSLMRKLMATLGQLGHTNECDDEIEAIMAFVKSR